MPAVLDGVHDEVLRAWVVFARARQRYWWRGVVGEPSHCWLMWSRFYPPDSMFTHESALKVEHTAGGLYQDWSPLSPAELLPSILASGPDDVLHLVLRVNRARVTYFGPLTCVSAVLAALNIDAPYCHTPAQLHRRLLEAGATSVVEG